MFQLTSLEVQCHISVNDPADDDQKRGDTKGNLDAGANCDTHGKVHLVPNSYHDGGDVLGSVSDDRDQDETNEALADMHRLYNGVDAADKVLSTYGDQNRDDDENSSGSNWTQGGLLRLIFLGQLPFGVKQVAVRTELENQVDDIEEQEDDGSAARQSEDAGPLANICVGSVEDGIKLEMMSAYDVVDKPGSMKHLLQREARVRQSSRS